MKWSLKLGTVAGIKIFVHWTFSILILWVFLLHIGQGHGAVMAAKGVLFVLALFGCVVLHELGHALTARRFNIKTRDITLLPIGGVARLERMPRDPSQELLVALAGPAVNVVIAALLFVVLLVFNVISGFGNILKVGGNFLAQLMFVNIFLVAFNLLPAFPMDGGRVLRALLARRLEYVQATQIAARVGQGMALLFGFVGFWVNPMLLLIALFVYLGAQEESYAVQVTSSMSGLEVHDAMITKFRTLAVEDSLALAAQELIASSQHDFPVMEGDKVVGVLTRDALMRALAERGPEAKVGLAMSQSCQFVAENEQLEKSYEILRQNNCSTMPVLREGHLVGLITLENIAEWVMVNTALRHKEHPARAAYS